MSDLVQLRAPVARPELADLGGGPVLVDRMERRVRYLRVSLTDRCSMRCTYCMPPEGIEHVARTQVLRLEEVVEIVAGFAAWGVERVRLTGGEPTLRRDICWLIERLAAIELPTRGPEGQVRRLEVVMTTNGDRLEQLASELAAAGLSNLTVSIDSLVPERFAQITRRDRLVQVIAGVDAAHRAGLPLKLNTVAIAGFNDDELGELCRFAWERNAVPRFIELMPMAAGRLFVPGELMPATEIRAAVLEQLGATQLEPLARDDAPLGPATYARVLGTGPWAGRRFGTIAAMTENFCGSCNRLRMSATGQLHACLARDEAGDLRRALRSGEAGALERVVRLALGVKRDTHGFELDGTGGPNKAMISIGG